MNKIITLKITAATLALFGLVALLFPFAIGHPKLFTLGTVMQAFIVLIAAWFVYKRKNIAVVILAISALLYFGAGLLEAYSHNLPPSALRSAFYWSFVARVLIVIFVAYLLSNTSSKLSANPLIGKSDDGSDSGTN